MYKAETREKLIVLNSKISYLNLVMKELKNSKLKLKQVEEKFVKTEQKSMKHKKGRK